MPSRDENGKRLSGHQLRKAKAVRESPAPKRKSAAKSAATSEPAPSGDDWFEGPNPFSALGPPPIENTAQLITWGAKVHALGVAHIAQNPNMYPNRREWVRALLDKTTQLGVIRDKAMEQSRIDAALRREEQEGKRQGLTDVRGRKAPQATRPTG